MIIEKDSITEFDQHYRTHFVNALPGFKSANLVGTQSKKGVQNVAVMSSAIHMGSAPPLIGLVIRPVRRDGGTLDNILNTGVYTLNHIHQDIISKAHQTSAKYPGEESEFEHVGLTPKMIGRFSAPFVAESRVKIALTLADHKPIELNGTHLVIGAVEFVEIEEGLLSKDGFIDLEKAQSVTISGLDRYHRTEHVTRLSYAKPGLPCKPI